MNKYSSGDYTRIGKSRARLLFEQGKVVHLQACNLRPSGPFSFAVPVQKSFDCPDFDKHVAAFEFYNCGLPECGKYAAFYTKDEEKEAQ